MKSHLLSGLCSILWFVSAGDALSLQSTNTKKESLLATTCFQPVEFHDYRHPDRRSALKQLTAVSGSLVLSPLLYPVSAVVASPLIPDPQAITTVVLDSADMRICVELYDVTIGNNPTQTFPAVKAVNPSGVAASEKVQPGMIVLGNYKDASKSVVSRIKNGPYPIVLQFYDLGQVGDYKENPIPPQQALLAAQQASKEAASQVKEPPLSAKGTGLVVKTVQKPKVPCPDKDTRARRGDTLEIKYEARVASPGGPIYDSSQERGHSLSFVLGSGEVVNGVDIGVNDMCPGEIREMDIPSTLGYGRFGSDIFDVPGDVRLWWRVELLNITKAEPKSLFSF